MGPLPHDTRASEDALHPEIHAIQRELNPVFLEDQVRALRVVGDVAREEPCSAGNLREDGVVSERLKSPCAAHEARDAAVDDDRRAECSGTRLGQIAHGVAVEAAPAPELAQGAFEVGPTLGNGFVGRVLVVVEEPAKARNVVGLENHRCRRWQGASFFAG
jgi:hypothetical protein